MIENAATGRLALWFTSALAVVGFGCTSSAEHSGYPYPEQSWHGQYPDGQVLDARGSDAPPGKPAHDAGRSDAATDRTKEAGARAASDGAADRARTVDAAHTADARLPASCDDNLMDGDETDIDCGGSCAPCGLGQRCLATTDCGSWPGCDPLAGCACSATTNRCVYNHCSDSVRDFGETDVDCGGGVCAGCGPEKACFLDSDCSTTLSGCDVNAGGCFCDLDTETCVYSHCFDHKYDYTETDLDCGGPACNPCPSGDMCQFDGDCTSDACDGIASRCVSDQCSDHRQDGVETDIDCGGQCPGCPVGDTCQTNFDCAAGTCSPAGGVHFCE
jgi:hypothetical protein